MEKSGKAAYSSDGYIINQPRMTDVPYGCLTSDQNGCGWISCWNILRAMGLERDASEIRAFLSKRSLFRGRLGTSPLRLRRCLKRYGVKTRLYILPKRAIAHADEIRRGIVLYRHKQGWHYVAFERANGTPPQFRYWNAVAGRENHIAPLDTFFSEEIAFPLVWLLAIA